MHTITIQVGQDSSLMSDEPDVVDIRLEVSESSSIDEVVLGFRRDGQFHELASLSPPVKATLDKLDK
jgi:hypothetical protein